MGWLLSVWRHTQTERTGPLPDLGPRHCTGLVGPVLARSPPVGRKLSQSPSTDQLVRLYRRGLAAEGQKFLDPGGLEPGRPGPAGYTMGSGRRHPGMAERAQWCTGRLWPQQCPAHRHAHGHGFSGNPRLHTEDTDARPMAMGPHAGLGGGPCRFWHRRGDQPDAGGVDRSVRRALPLFHWLPGLDMPDAASVQGAPCSWPRSVA